MACLPAGPCLLSQDQGSCQNYTMMWFFDSQQRECSRFWFGGCGGNENRFKTQDECENVCVMKSREEDESQQYPSSRRHLDTI